MEMVSFDELMRSLHVVRRTLHGQKETMLGCDGAVMGSLKEGM